MRLVRLRINRLPGIDEPYEIQAGGAGVHVVFGPNAVGKSSICRAVEGLYWGEAGSGERTWVAGEFELAGESWRAERDGPHVRWRREGEERKPPRLPGSRHRNCFFLHLRDLVDPAPTGTRDIASEIRRQMSGGFDLAEIVEALYPGVSQYAARLKRRDFTLAARAVQAAEGRQVGLERRAARRKELVEELGASSLAVRRRPFVVRAAALAGRTEEHAEVVRSIEAMPAVLDRFSGEEVDRVEGLEQEDEKLRKRERRLEGDLEKVRAAGRDARLPAVLADAELGVWRRRADELSRLELGLKAARTESHECRRAVEAALRELGGSDLDQAVITLDEHARLFGFLREAEEHRRAKSAAEARLQLLDDVDVQERVNGGETRPEDLRSAVQTLRRWLRSPSPETPAEGARTRRAWLFAALGIVLAGGGLAVFADPRFGLLLALGAGALAPVLFMRFVRQGAGGRAEAEEAYGRLDLDPPAVWDVRSVESRLRGLEEIVAGVEARREMAKYRAADRQHLRSALGALAEVEPSLEVRRRRLLEELGLDAMPHDAELVDIARSLDELRVARIRHERAEGRVDELEGSAAALLAELSDTLQRHGEPGAEDASTAKAFLDRLTARNTQLAKSVSDERRTKEQGDDVSRDRIAVRVSISEIYSKAGLDDGDLPGLRTFVDQLDAYRSLRTGAFGLERQIASDREALEEAGESGLAELDRGSLDRMAHELSTEAGREDELRRELAELEAEVKEAREGTSLQELILRQEDARAQLRERRDEAIFAGAGRFLVDAVEREYERTQMPRVFERARSHFSEFTHHGYELRLGRDSKVPRLFAIDLRSSESRELDALSDGTRAQLLLAARVAFAEEVEGGVTLPLFLDEALDQSDPARFEAIVGSLGRIAKEQGRQIFYLTSDPFDRERIRRALAVEECDVASEIDLGSVRRRGGGAIKDSSALRVPPKPSVPMPGGVTAEEYGRLLGVPEFDPARGYARQHFFYLLSDNLELLHALLENRIEWAGQWKTVSSSRLAAGLTSYSETSGQISARVRLLEVFSEAWNQGRGRAVDRDALVQSRALSERYLDDVVEVAGELAGNPHRVLAALRSGKTDPRLKGFRQSRADALEEHLRDRGYIDDRPVLGEGDVRLRALASPPAHALPNGVAIGCLDRWWAWAGRMSGSGP